MIIVDSHCHLDIMQDCDSTDNIIMRAKQSNVHYLQTICTKLDDFENILSIAQHYKNVFVSVGVHPNEVKSLVEAETLLLLSQHQKVISFGETGLDYFHNTDLYHQEMQRLAFEQHIIASQKNNLPLIVHTRDAEEDTSYLIKKYQKQQEFPGLIHCFTSSQSFALKMLDIGMYISISGIVTFKNAKALQEIVKYIPLERMLVETDSPYLSPVPKRGLVNEPAHTKFVVEFIAQLKGISVQKVAEYTTHNFFNLFKKAYK